MIAFQFCQDLITLEKTCLFCNQTHRITVNTKDYKAWKEGALIQDVFHYLTANDREILISGICGTCFDKTTK